MVYMTFPAALTEEEEQLKMKYAKLRKKRKMLLAMRTAKPEPKQESTQPTKRPSENAEDAMVQAKKLVQSGAIKLDTGKRGKHGFKRSNNFEKKMKDSTVGFQPFSATQEEPDERLEQSPRPRGKALYDNFVSASKFQERREERRDDRRDRTREREQDLPKKGNTIYVNGNGVTESILKKAFSNMGTIVNVSMEADRNCGFVTFEKMEAADQAIAEMNKIMIDNVTLHVSMARRQPAFETVQDQSSSSWTTIAASTSQKGSGHKDKRDMVSYEDGDIF